MKIFPEKMWHPKTAALNILHTLPTTIEYMAAATLASTLLYHFSANITNISIIYTLAIILIGRSTGCYGSGILASAFAVFWVNYAYTYPYMKLNFTLSGYPVTFLGMMLISCLTSSVSIMLTRQNQQLQEQSRLLMDAEKETMKANLMRAMSHDLRTPLTTIIGSSTTYLEQEDILNREDKRRLVRNIEEDAQWLLTMVENLLTVTRLQDERGVANIIKKDESLEELISATVTRFRKRFPNTPVHVTIPEAFIMVPMDATLITQVINNLMENAYFHSGSTGPIDLLVTTDKKYVNITIKDYGKGIRPEILSTLFDGGGVSANQSGDSHKGMGIGLTLCKTIITAHGGSISASNHPKGAQFTFTLPDWREF